MTGTPDTAHSRRMVRRVAVRGVAVVAVAAVLLVAAGDHWFAPPVPRAGPPDNAPRVIVAMGDSTISGEGIGSYEPGTDGERGHWCHRSSQASVHHLGVPGIADTINLACSGAPSGQVGLGKVVQYGEPSQAGRLAKVAATHRVVAIVVATGANDDPQFSHVLDSCVSGWAVPNRPGCAVSIGPDWQRRVDAMVPKVARALRDIHKVMRDAGYHKADYELVLQSYAAPVGPNMVEGLRNLSGCPLLTDDLRWVNDVAVPMITTGLRRAAESGSARFLDLSRAGIGHEACSAADDPTREWFTRLTVRWDDLHNDSRITHALQESFHPNAAGHAQVGRCLGEFLATTDPVAACLAGRGGNLHPTAPS